MIDLKEMKVGTKYRDVGSPISVTRMHNNYWLRYDYDYKKSFHKIKEGEWKEDNYNFVWTYEDLISHIDYSEYLTEEEIKEIKNDIYFQPKFVDDIGLISIKLFPNLFKRYLEQSYIPEIKEEIKKNLLDSSDKE